MRKGHVVVLAALIGGAVATGAYATVRTTDVGSAGSKPASAESTDAIVASRTAKLDALEKRLQKAAEQKPPALPPLSQSQTVSQTSRDSSSSPDSTSTRDDSSDRSGSESSRSSTNEQEHEQESEHENQQGHEQEHESEQSVPGSESDD